MTELEELIRDQARDARRGHRADPRPPWVATSADALPAGSSIEELHTTHAPASRRRFGAPPECPVHGWASMRMDVDAWRCRPCQADDTAQRRRMAGVKERRKGRAPQASRAYRARCGAKVRTGGICGRFADHKGKHHSEESCAAKARWQTARRSVPAGIDESGRTG